MCDLARWWQDHPDRQDFQLKDLLQQLARELMILSASDWQFLISTWAARDYAELRLAEHYADFKRIAVMADKKIAGQAISGGEWTFFADCKARDTLFPELDIEWFSRVEFPAEQPASV
jgi:1,4-alpha-glucan branching enzyme